MKILTVMMQLTNLKYWLEEVIFSIPTYEFKETYDDNGNPIWNCECHIAEEDYYFDGTSISKKEAKKDSAFRMLFYVLGMEGE